MNRILLRIIRAIVAVIVPQILPLVPGFVAVLPPPYNLILTPALMGIGKGLRDGLNPTNVAGHWTNYIPF